MLFLGLIYIFVIHKAATKGSKTGALSDVIGPGSCEAADALIITGILGSVFPLLTWEQPSLISIRAAAI